MTNRRSIALAMGCTAVVLSLATMLVLRTRAQSTPRVGGADSLTIIHANLIDGVGDAPVMDATVIVVNGHIQSVGPGASAGVAGNSPTIIDLKGAWLLPGFVDAHAHIADMAAARRALMSGTTTAGEAGVDHFADVGLRELNHAGVADVPDMIAAGYHVRPHPADAFFLDFPQLADLLPGVHGPDAVRRMVRAMASKGVNRIKVMATERAGLPDTDPRIRIFTDQELAAVVDEASKNNLWVVAHAHGDEGAAAAVRAGVHAIEHGTYMSDDTLRLMKEKGTYLDPTLSATEDLADPEGDYDNPMLQIRGRAMLPVIYEMVAHAWKIGVKIVAGSDTAYNAQTNRRMADEIIDLTKAGIPPMDAIKAGTSGSAADLGVEKRTGSIRVGFEADLIAVSRNPLEDIRHIADVILVINNGRVAMSRLNVSPRP